MRTSGGRRQVMPLLWVALGAVPGALLRWSLANTLAANTLGCFVVGASGLLGSTTDRRRLLLGIGFAGSLTSFSTWVLALVSHLQQGEWLELVRQVVVDTASGVGALLIGATTYRRLSEAWNRRLRR